MNILLIIYFVSVVLAGMACFIALKIQWEAGVDIDILDLLAATTVASTPVLNTFVVISATVEFIALSPVVIKGKGNK